MCVPTTTMASAYGCQAMNNIITLSNTMGNVFLFHFVAQIEALDLYWLLPSIKMSYALAVIKQDHISTCLPFLKTFYASRVYNVPSSYRMIYKECYDLT